jgi:hypothetical protein
MLILIVRQLYLASCNTGRKIEPVGVKFWTNILIITIHASTARQIRQPAIYVKNVFTLQNK